MSIIQNIVDGWESVRKGIRNPVRDAALHTSQLTVETLSNLYDYDWLGRRICRALPEFAMMKGVAWQNPETQKRWDMMNRVEGLRDGAFLQALCLAQAHGISALFLGQSFGGSDLGDPRTEAPITWLEPIPATDLVVTSAELTTDVSNPRYNLPEYYKVVGQGRLRNQRIHHSRLAMFYGPSLAAVENSRNPLILQQASVLDPVHDVMVQYGLTWTSASQLVFQASVGVMSLKNLVSGLAENAKEVGSRLALHTEMLSSFKTIFLEAGAGESYERKPASFAELPEMLKMQILQIAAASKIPVSELFGRIVSGLGDTGEVEDRKWIREGDNFRKNVITPALQQILPGEEFTFEPLLQETKTEKVNNFKTCWTMGTVTNGEARKFTEEILLLPEATDDTRKELEAQNSRESF